MQPASGDDERTADDGDARHESDGPVDERGVEESGGESVFGPRPDEGATELVPGRPDPENVLFVVLGVAASLVVVADLLGLL